MLPPKSYTPENATWAYLPPYNRSWTDPNTGTFPEQISDVKNVAYTYNNNNNNNKTYLVDYFSTHGQCQTKVTVRIIRIYGNQGKDQR